MTIKPLILLPDPLLRQHSAPIAQVDDDVRRLADDMLETMYDAPGIGLAAIQIGVPRRVVGLLLATIIGLCMLRAQRAHAAPFDLEGREVHFTVSVGASTFPRDGEEFDVLLRNAEAAMLRGKQAGGEKRERGEDPNASQSTPSSRRRALPSSRRRACR